MLEEMLKSIFENDSKAASGSSADKIKADVLSRIERNERHMKHFSIKSVIIAAAAAVIGLTTVAVSVSASVDKEAVEEESVCVGIDVVGGKITESEALEINERTKQASKYVIEYCDGIKADADKKGEIIIEKCLDETDINGYVPKYYETSLRATPTEKEIEWVTKFEEDPQSLGLVPAGKSETFEGGYRIVNRHYTNTNEVVDDEKTYYSFRRVYTDDEENRLIASMYFGYSIYDGPDFIPGKSAFMPSKVVLNVFLDHTEEGCLDHEGDQKSFYFCSERRFAYFRYYLVPNKKSDKSVNGVTATNFIYVAEDDSQLLD